MARNPRQEIGKAMNKIVCGKSWVDPKRAPSSAELAALSVEDISKKVIEGIRYAQEDSKREKVDTPEFWECAGKSYLAVLLSKLVEEGPASFQVHLTCFGRRWK